MEALLFFFFFFDFLQLAIAAESISSNLTVGFVGKCRHAKYEVRHELASELLAPARTQTHTQTDTQTDTDTDTDTHTQTYISEKYRPVEDVGNDSRGRHSNGAFGIPGCNRFAESSPSTTSARQRRLTRPENTEFHRLHHHRQQLQAQTRFLRQRGPLLPTHWGRNCQCQRGPRLQTQRVDHRFHGIQVANSKWKSAIRSLAGHRG